MEQFKNKHAGFLISGDTSIPVYIAYGSQYSVRVNFSSKPIPDHKSEYDMLTLHIFGSDFEFGLCRFLKEPSTEEYDGTIVFLNDVYDFKNFFLDNKLLTLEILSKNKKLMLGHKGKVKDPFKQFTSDMMYDLKVYKHFFDEFDSKSDGLPETVKTTVFEALVSKEEGEFFDFHNRIFDEFDELVKDYTKEEREIHGFYLRKQLWDIISCSEFMKRTNIKPRGYAGDSEMMRMIYDNDYRGDSTFSKILNKFGLGVAAAQSVRNRRLMIPQILHQVQNEFAERNQNQLKFMSVACGPAYELSDLFKSKQDIKKFHCTLLDQDTEALAEAESNIHTIEKTLNSKINATYIEDSVRTMIKTPELYNLWGRSHFIYSMGLFDYLTQPVAKVVIEKIYSLLEPGGKILIGNYHHQNISRNFMEYWLDWVLIYRSEEEMMDLLRDTDAQDISIIFEESNCQMFLTAQKPLT